MDVDEEKFQLDHGVANGQLDWIAKGNQLKNCVPGPRRPRSNSAPTNNADLRRGSNSAFPRPKEPANAPIPEASESDEEDDPATANDNGNTHVAATPLKPTSSNLSKQMAQFKLNSSPSKSPTSSPSKSFKAPGLSDTTANSTTMARRGSVQPMKPHTNSGDQSPVTTQMTRSNTITLGEAHRANLSKPAKKSGFFHMIGQKLTGGQKSNATSTSISNPTTTFNAGTTKKSPDLANSSTSVNPVDSNSSLTESLSSTSNSSAEKHPMAIPTPNSNHKSSLAAAINNNHASANSIGVSPKTNTMFDPAEMEKFDFSNYNYFDCPAVGTPIMKTMSVPDYPSSSPGSSLFTKLRRFSSRNSSTSNEALDSADSYGGRTVLNKNPNRPTIKVEQLNNVLTPRVRFDVGVFERDPPQQIPSRHTQPGNIVFHENGEVTRTKPRNPHYVLPLNYHAAAQSAAVVAHESGIKTAQVMRTNGLSNYSRLLKGNNGSNNNSPVTGPINDDDFDKGLSDQASSKTLLIDTPMQKKSGDKSQTDLTSQEDGEDADEAKTEEPPKTLEAIYTRCCHLREILPIPATLKQLKGQEAPLPRIRIMNTKPTMIEVLCFADFLAVAPVLVVILDNVTLSNDMLKIIFSSLSYSKDLLKVSLRNVVLDTEGWKLLCAFLCKNSSVTRLDISMQVLARKPSAAGSKESPQPSPETFNRSNCDWVLFNEAIKCRNGLEELLINGCMIPDDSLEMLVNDALTISTKRLGLASNDLHAENLEVVGKWVSQPSASVEGLDLGGNDLSNCQEVLTKIVCSPSLFLLSLNSTNINFHEEESYYNNFINGIKASRLRFLDLGSNPQLFPAFTRCLAETLPEMKHLRRIHLDNENLSSKDVIILSEAFAKCKKLNHINLLDNDNLDNSACSAVVVATLMSSSIYGVEVNAKWPEEFTRRLAHYCINNMEILSGKLSEEAKLADVKDSLSKEDRTELVFGGTELAKAVEEILDDATSDKTLHELPHSVLARAMVDRLIDIHQTVKNRLKELVGLKAQQVLSTDEKESIVSLYLLSVHLRSCIRRYRAKYHSADDSSTGSSLPASDNADNGSSSMKHELHQSVRASSTLSQLEDHMLLSGRYGQSLPTDNDDLEVAPIDGESLTPSVSRSSSHSNLKKQDMEEGKVMKFASAIQTQIANTKDRDKLLQAADDEHLGKLPPQVVDRLSRLSGASGMELREMLNNDKERSSITELVSSISKNCDISVDDDDNAPM